MNDVDATHLTVSAGGIVVRRQGEVVELLVVKRFKNIDPKWRPVLCQLPKGGTEPNETLKQAALREVLEETGYEARILYKAGTVSWKYFRKGCEWAETVHYYFMSVAQTPPRPHDQEFEDVCWIKIEEAAQVLSYPEEQNLIAGILDRHALPS